MSCPSRAWTLSVSDEVNVRGPYERLAITIADEALNHDGVACVVVVWSGRLPVHLPLRSDVPESIGIRFTTMGALGPCITYMFRRVLPEPDRRRLEALFPKATFFWRTHDPIKGEPASGA